MKNDEKIFVTRPLLPELEKVYNGIEEIWKSKWVTNMGDNHNLLETRLQDTLKVKNTSLFNNGTIALLVAIQALYLPKGSEVITTPFTFAATPHCITWNGLKPVFCDIEKDTMCIDADKIEKMITPATSAIVGVHVYGFPCDVYKINKIAQKHNLRVIYDAAHAFSTEIDGRGIGEFGDITMFSFHATKLFNSIEGGCLTYTNDKLRRKVYNLRNFGIQNEELVEDVGINGKMNELQALIGLLNLEIFRDEQDKRQLLKRAYDERINKIEGIRVPIMPSNTTNSLQYYPIIVEDNYMRSRNELHELLKKANIITRKYFYPICSDFDCYKNVSSANADNLIVANDLKNRVLCLPFYGDLEHSIAEKICSVIAQH